MPVKTGEGTSMAPPSESAIIISAAAIPLKCLPFGQALVQFSLFPFVRHYIITFIKFLDLFRMHAISILLSFCTWWHTNTGPYRTSCPRAWARQPFGKVQVCVYVREWVISAALRDPRALRSDIIYQFIFGSYRLTLHIYLWKAIYHREKQYIISRIALTSFRTFLLF